jgi:hypothetical protein
MSATIFIGGFANWGKSQIIFNLFNRQQFDRDAVYPVIGLNADIRFTVHSQSNDDLRRLRFVEGIEERIQSSPFHGEYLFSTLCPSIEPNNSFIDILSNPPFAGYTMRHILLIEYKWDLHAKLLIENILTAGQQLENVNFIVINEGHDLPEDNDRRMAKLAQIRQTLNDIFTI